MKQKIILNTVIDEVYRIEDYLVGWRDNELVPLIERDVVQRKLQEIYDHLLHLETTQLNTVKPIVAPVEKSEPQEPTLTIPKVEISVPGPVQEIVFEKTTEVIEEAKTIIQEIPLKTEPLREFTEVKITTTEIETEKHKTSSKEILAEKLSQPHRLINETVKSRTTQDVSSKLKSTPISSIQAAINLNEKFVFIRELFKNNNLLYNQTLERLNIAGTYDDALFIIEKEFAWDMNDPIVMKLIELVKRKHNA